MSSRYIPRVIVTKVMQKTKTSSIHNMSTRKLQYVLRFVKLEQKLKQAISQNYQTAMQASN